MTETNAILYLSPFASLPRQWFVSFNIQSFSNNVIEKSLSLFPSMDVTMTTSNYVHTMNPL